MYKKNKKKLISTFQGNLKKLKFRRSIRIYFFALTVISKFNYSYHFQNKTLTFQVQQEGLKELE